MTARDDYPRANELARSWSVYKARKFGPAAPSSLIGEVTRMFDELEHLRQQHADREPVTS